MDRAAVLSRLESLRLITDALADDILTGSHRSPFKGQGIEFAEVRRYERDDDARAIDWNVSARFGAPYIKLYREERESTVFLVTDISRSMDTGIGQTSRHEQAVLVSALMALAAVKADARLGAAVFDAELDRFFAPKRGRPQAMAVIDYLLDQRAERGGSALASVLAGACRRLKRRSLVLIVSDFLCLDWDRGLAEFAGRHDFAAFRIIDPMDAELPSAGLAVLHDPETGVICRAPTASPSFRNEWRQYQDDRREAWRATCDRYRVGHCEISTDDDTATSLRRYFQAGRLA